MYGIVNSHDGRKKIGDVNKDQYIYYMQTNNTYAWYNTLEINIVMSSSASNMKKYVRNIYLQKYLILYESFKFVSRGPLSVSSMIGKVFPLDITDR